MVPHVAEEVRIEDEEDRHRAEARTEDQEEEDMAQEVVCEVHHRQDGMETDEGVLRLVYQCKARPWVGELLHLDTITDTTIKAHHRVRHRRMATGDRHHLGRCPSDKPLRWTTATAHLRRITDYEKATVMLQACWRFSRMAFLQVHHKGGHPMV